MDTIGKHRRGKFFYIALVFMLVVAGIFTYMPKAQSTGPQAKQETEDRDGTGTEPDADVVSTAGSTSSPDATEEPAWTSEPSATPQASSIPKPSDSPKPNATPKPTASPTKAPSRLKKVSGVKLVRYSTHSVKATWNGHKKAKFYRVYYYKKNENPRLAGITKSTQYIVKKLKNHTTYYFYVVAGKTKKKSERDSNPSQEAHIKTKTYVHKTIFAGDSICQGIAYGQAFPQMHFKGKKKVIAYRGLNTITFHTKRIFNGQTGLQKLISEKPYRVYMMLGMNEIHYRGTGSMIAEYKGMLQAIRQGSPDTDIVLCALSPVTRAERARHPGYWQISLFNKKLEKLAKQTGATYFDYTSFLKDSGGYLKAEYAERDGYHWKASAYTVFGKVVNKFDKSLDQ